MASRFIGGNEHPSLPRRVPNRHPLANFECIRGEPKAAPAIRKLKDVVVYQDDQFYSAFPSIVRRRDGELLVAFRRAPDRRRLGENNISHTDPNSYLVLVRSRDDGAT